MIKKIGIIGGGNLGTAIVQGILKANAPYHICITRRQPEKITALNTEKIQISSDNSNAVIGKDIVFLAVLPQQVNTVLEEIKSWLKPNQLVVSLVSGVSIDEIKSFLPKEIIVLRAMPNTAVAICESMTCLASKPADSSFLSEIETFFNFVGSTVKINESQMTSATALCACGIAFFLRAIRAASQGGIEIDFHAEDALKMAAQTAKGAAALLLHNHSHPEEEIDKVTSPKGCTIAGLNEMEHHGFSSAFIRGIILSANRAGGLYKK